MWSKKVTAAAAVASALVGGLIAMSPASSSAAGRGAPIVIGVSLSETGALGPFNPAVEAGYRYAFNKVNRAGGLDVGGTKHRVKLVILDNQSNAALSAQQNKTLVEQDHAVALLGGVTPPIDIPEDAAAEALHIPYVTSVVPSLSWLQATKGKAHWGWDFFFSPVTAVQDELGTMAQVATNKKIALFTDNEVDGLAWGQLVSTLAPKAGYKIVEHAVFPVGTTNYQSDVQAAQSNGAQIVIAQMDPPDGITLWKQMKSLSYDPKLAFCDKCGDGLQWGASLGSLAHGTLAQDFWSKSEHMPGDAAIEAALGKQFPDDYDIAGAVATDSAAQVLFDAISRAGSTSPSAINAAIAKTNKDYPFGHIKFTKGNVAETPSFMEQWQGNRAVQVFPKVPGVTLQSPNPGL